MIEVNLFWLLIYFGPKTLFCGTIINDSGLRLLNLAFNKKVVKYCFNYPTYLAFIEISKNVEICRNFNGIMLGIQIILQTVNMMSDYW